MSRSLSTPQRKQRSGAMTEHQFPCSAHLKAALWLRSHRSEMSFFGQRCCGELTGLQLKPAAPHRKCQTWKNVWIFWSAGWMSPPDLDNRAIKDSWAPESTRGGGVWPEKRYEKHRSLPSGGQGSVRGHDLNAPAVRAASRRSLTRLSMRKHTHTHTTNTRCFVCLQRAGVCVGWFSDKPLIWHLVKPSPLS